MVVVILLVSVDVTVVLFVITVVRFVDRRWLSWLLVFVGVVVVICIRAIIVDVDVLVFVVIAGISRCAWCFVALRQKQLYLHYNLRIKNKLKNIEWEEEMHAPYLIELDDEDVEDAPMVEMWQMLGLA